MEVEDLLAPERVVCNIDARSHKHMFEILSELLGNGNHSGLPTNEILNSLSARERLGSTGLGDGVAIPHGRASGLSRPSAAFVKLASPVDYEAPDGQAVDLALAILLPEGEQGIDLLALSAEILSDPELLSVLRDCRNSRSLHSLLIDTAKKWQREHGAPSP